MSDTVMADAGTPKSSSASEVVAMQTVRSDGKDGTTTVNGTGETTSPETKPPKQGKDKDDEKDKNKESAAASPSPVKKKRREEQEKKMSNNPTVNLPEGYYPVECGARGACAYKSFADQLGRSAESIGPWKQYKRLILQHLKSLASIDERKIILRNVWSELKNDEDVQAGDQYAEDFASSDRKWRDQVDRVFGRDWMWANEKILHAASEVFGVRIEVYHFGKEIKLPDTFAAPDRPTPEIFPQHAKFYGRRVMLWFDGQHYQSLHPRDTKQDWTPFRWTDVASVEASFGARAPDFRFPQRLVGGFYEGEIVMVMSSTKKIEYARLMGQERKATKLDYSTGEMEPETLYLLSWIWSYRDIANLWKTKALAAEYEKLDIVYDSKKEVFVPTPSSEVKAQVEARAQALVDEKFNEAKFKDGDYALASAKPQSFPIVSPHTRPLIPRRVLELLPSCVPFGISALS